MGTQSNRNQERICPWCNSNLSTGHHTPDCQFVKMESEHHFQLSGVRPGERIRHDVVPPLRVDHMFG